MNQSVYYAMSHLLKSLDSPIIGIHTRNVWF